MITMTSTESKIPIFLLKTKSTPTDAYQDLFTSPPSGPAFEPIFVPVLEHQFLSSGLSHVRHALQNRLIGSSETAQYGGLIFTSQRAVEAFTHLVQETQPRDQPPEENGWPFLQSIPVYSVGPATTRALKAVPQCPPLQVFGEETGTGEKLAPLILEHYGQWYKDREAKPPLLFLVGEKRRDVIPKVLTAAGFKVEEVVVYGTDEKQSFEEDFAHRLAETESAPRRWVVVFSPTGCESMLRALGVLDKETGLAKRDESSPKRQTLVATIGPTTRDYLINKCGFFPDAVAGQPSPEGVWKAILECEETLRRENAQPVTTGQPDGVEV